MTVGKIEQLTQPTTVCKHGHSSRQCLLCELEQENERLKGGLTAVTHDTPPPLYPDDASVLRAQITKLVQENQRLERENVRLQKLIDDPCGLLARAKQQVRYGCHCDLQPGQTPDGCVIDDNMPGLCDHAGKFLRKEECPEWRPIKQKGQ
jgi:hypothetical protein